MVLGVTSNVPATPAVATVIVLCATQHCGRDILGFASFVGRRRALKLASERDALGQRRAGTRVSVGCHGESKWEEDSSGVHCDVLA